MRRPAVVFALLAPMLGACRDRVPAEKIAFVSLRTSPPSVHLIGADGKDLEQISRTRVWVASPPVWSPDGTRVAYTIETGPDRWAVAVYDLATKVETIVAERAKLEAWAPDGATLVVTNVVDADDVLEGKKALKRTLQQLTAVGLAPGSKKVPLSDRKGWDFSPAVSPDSTRVAYVSNRNDGVELRVVGLDGGNAKRLLRGTDPLSAPHWSPDGTRIAFECKRPGDQQRICRIDAGGGNLVELTSAPWSASPTWSPDGSRIAFVTKGESGDAEIWTMDPEGAGAMPVAKGGRCAAPAWSHDGTRLAYMSEEGTGSARNGEVYLTAANGSGKPANLSADPARDSFPSWQPRPKP